MCVGCRFLGWEGKLEMLVLWILSVVEVLVVVVRIQHQHWHYLCFLMLRSL
jgi:hypothetical protein